MITDGGQRVRRSLQAPISGNTPVTHLTSVCDESVGLSATDSKHD
jgi:hypothetical protein